MDDGDAALPPLPLLAWLDGSSSRDVDGRAIMARMPDRAPGAGEQYRFHFDMAACIGCKCCVVACNEQNGNPAAINWRRVAELEGGWFPHATRSYLSMGCHHCIEPTCLQGCPVDAYAKDPVTGIVRHSADACIGCQYCTWNCSYGVPQYNSERGVVGKCDMCHGRLALGQMPACVSACPQGAIGIEIVGIERWRDACAGAAAGSGRPVGDHSLSTTRITIPDGMPPRTRAREITHVVPADPHWPLVVMTVLTQISVGAFATIWLLQLFGSAPALGIAAITSLLVAGLALAASTLHLGRPAHAYRALKMWRRSWVSREVVLFSAFSAVAAAYAATLWWGVAASVAIGGLTVLLGVSGVTASAYIYRVPARPAWNTPFTLVQFHLTSAVLGPLFAAAVGLAPRGVLTTVAAIAGGATSVLIALCFFRLIASDRLELRNSARLLSTVLATRFVVRGVLLTAGAVVLPMALAGPEAAMAAFVIAAAGELLGRHLFFVSVVPAHLAAPYVALDSEAA